jgi:hypothetical protein
MGWLDVIANGRTIDAPAFPSGTPFSERYILGGDPPATPPNTPTSLVATARSSSVIDLLWTDNSPPEEDSFEIQRSLDGSSFTPLTSVGANTTVYSDSNLAAATNYHYQVRATNSAGPSAWSDSASATTDDATAGTSLQVGSLVLSTVSAGPKGAKAGRADIVVIDNQGNPVQGATVSGDFTGDINEPATSGATDAVGATSVQTTGLLGKGKASLTFCVTSITDGPEGLDDFSGSVCASL